MKKLFLLFILMLLSCKRFVTTTTGVAEKSTRTIRTADQIRIDYDLEKRLKNIVRDEFVGEIEYCGFNAVSSSVLAVCIVKNEYAKNRLLEKMHSILEIKKIHYEVIVDPLLKKQRFLDYFKKKLIDMKFMFKSSIKSINYEFTVLNGTVYLIGIVAQKGEMENAAKTIATIKGVKSVVSYTVNNY